MVKFETGIKYTKSNPILVALVFVEISIDLGIIVKSALAVTVVRCIFFGQNNWMYLSFSLHFRNRYG